jgi:HTH-type transcriptional regulator/antitoxin HipB
MDYTAYPPKHLGQTLRGHRKSQQHTQQDAAKMVGLLPKTVSKLELATETATIESLFKLLSALQLELVVRSRSPDAQPKEW